MEKENVGSGRLRKNPEGKDSDQQAEARASSWEQIKQPALHFTAPTPGAVTVHPGSGIVSTCLFGTLDREWATASIAGLEFDTLLLTRGSNRIWKGQLGNRPFTVEPHGTLLISFIPQGTPAEMTYYAEANTSSFLMFPPLLLRSMMPGDGTAALVPFAMIDNGSLIELFQMIETEILAPESGGTGHIEMLTRMLAHYLVDQPFMRSSRERPRMDISPFKLMRVLDYIDDNLSVPVDLDAMAKVAGLSRFYFASVFRRATGRPPYQHLIHRRVARAQTLIAQSELSLADIALASGFSSPAQFSTSFRRETGQSPTRYRVLVRRGVKAPGEVIPEP